MGHDMLGSDINEKTLHGAERNVQWVTKEFRVTNEAKLFVHDARKPMKGDTYDAIAFEGYLGEPQTRLKSKGEFDASVVELTKLYVDFFKAISSFKGSVICALPFFRTKEGDLYLERAIKEIEKLGFKKELNLQYARADQIVGRDIFRFSAV